MNDTTSVLTALTNLNTIRSQAERLLSLARDNKSSYFAIDEERLLPTAEYIISVIKKHYPHLDIPYHSRWRHFEAGGRHRISSLHQQLSPIAQDEWGKILFELVIIVFFLMRVLEQLGNFLKVRIVTVVQKV